MAFRLLPNGKRCGVLALAARRLSLAVFYGVLCSGMGFAADPSSFMASFDLTASRLDINEGDVVEFDVVNKRYFHSPSAWVYDLEADLSTVKWDFGALAEGQDEAFGLYNIKHRFTQDSEYAFLVKATHQNTTKQVSIRVYNVAPTIHSVSVTKPAVKGEPLVFQAGAKDPGWGDILEYKWTFGDGATDTGMAVTHTYASDGIYKVKLEVSDEHKKDTSAGEFDVRVGKLPFTPGELDVKGDITISGAEIDGVILVGSTANPTDPTAGGVCQLRLEMRSAEYNTGFTFTALLDPGLAPGHYNIGKTSEWDGQHKNDASALGTFFASYQAPKDQARRNFRGMWVGGPFWSDGGRVTITKFDGETLELNFEAVLTENIPEMYDPRKVTVVGGLSSSVPSAVAEPGIDDVDNATEDPGLDGLGLDIEGGLNFTTGSVNLKTYLCGGEEPAEFEVVSSFPEANATNAEYVDTGIRVMFTQAVDPDSLMDNAFVEIRGNSETYKLPGSWVVSRRNSKTINFIPQATLLPGLIHCVRLNAGPEGIRSMGGNTLTGSSLNGFSQALAPACNFADASDDASENHRFAFSTQVELMSVWVDFYQASLAGGRVKLVSDKPTVARVYPYWRSRYVTVHPAAHVTEFSATVFITRDKKAFFPEQSTMIKRPDLFTAEQSRRAKNSVNFFEMSLNVKNTLPEASAFAVIKPLPNNGALLRTVYPGAISEVNLMESKTINLAWIYAQGVCIAGAAPEECGWDAPVMPYVSTEQFSDTVSGLEFGFANMPARLPYLVQDWEEDVVPCTEGYQDGICIDGEVIMMRLQGPLETRAEDVVQRLAGLVENHDYPDVESILATVVWVAPGLLPDPDNEPIQLYLLPYPLSPLILAQADRADAAELAYFLVKSVLAENGCHHYRSTGDCYPTAVSDDHPWTVQGHRLMVGFEAPHFNKHHAEGNEESDTLIPFLRDGPDDERNLRNTFISAYNYKRLFAPIANRQRIWKEDNPD